MFVSPPLNSPCFHFSSVSTLSLHRCFPESGITLLSKHTMSQWDSMWEGQMIMYLNKLTLLFMATMFSFCTTHIMVPGFDLVLLNWKQLYWWTVDE